MEDPGVEKGGRVYNMFRDYWQLLRRQWNVEGTEAYWDCLIRDVDAFYQAHQTEFAKELALVLLNEIERKCKSEDKNRGKSKK